MQIEIIKETISEHLPVIIDYILTLLAYILVLIFKTKVSKTRQSLHLLFKDKVNAAEAKLDMAIQQYNEAKNELDAVRNEYETRIAKLENTLNSMLEVDDGTEGTELHEE